MPMRTETDFSIKRMKTKLCLLAAALLGASAVTGAAQVYSVNAVGFVNVVIPAGPNSFTIIANPLNAADNSVAALFPSVPAGSAIYTFNGTSFVANNRGFSAWSNPTQTLVPGQAFFFKNPSASAITNTFVGEVPQGTLTTPLSAGFQLVSSQVPQSGLVTTDLGMPATTGEAVYRFVNGAYQSFNRGFGTSWSPSEPTVQVGEGFFVKKNASPAAWVRTFSVNN